MPPLIKKAMEVVFDKKQKPSMFLSNFFPKKQLTGIKVEVQGRTVKSLYSVDTKLGTGGRRIDLSSHEKNEFVVPEYNDYSVISEEDMFKVQLGETEYTSQTARVADLITDRQEIISDAQRRAEEKQASDALFNGMIVLADGTKIEFNKKETHTIDATGLLPTKYINQGCKLCVDDGKVGTALFNFIVEDFGLSAILSNSDFKENSNKDNGINRTNINMPEELTPGAMFHGQFSNGSFKINLWTYNEKYTIPKGYGFAGEGTEVGYIPRGCGILLPNKPNFRRYYGAVNRVDASTGSNIGGAKLNLQMVEQLPYAYDKVKGGSAITEAGVKSRPLMVPVDIDSFVTFKNLG